jgi:hypothetical protein
MFKSDIFSKSTPKWFCLDKKDQYNFNFLNNAFFGSSDSGSFEVEHSGTLEINSKNFRITSGNSTFLLKKLNSDTVPSSIVNITKIIKFLSENNVQVAKPLPFKNNEYIFKHDSFLWTMNEFIDGDFFSGTKGQLETAPIHISDCVNTLSKLPKAIYPLKGPSYEYTHFKLTTEKMKRHKVDWSTIFGIELSELITDSFGTIDMVIDKLRDFDFNGGPTLPSHYDIHPHNLLYRENELKAIIDYDSIKLMPVGYGIAFSSLKLCKQSIVKNPELSPKSTGHIFKEKLRNNLNIETSWMDNFLNLALVEIMRRICIILNLNLDNQNTQWNKVLPIQLEHLKEAQILFEE